MDLSNSIVYFNGPADAPCSVQSETFNVGFSNIQGSFDGEGIIDQDPLFSGSDYHLLSQAGRWNGTTWILDQQTSPCIDTGDPQASFDQEPEPNGARANLGAYGQTSLASKTVSK